MPIGIDEEVAMLARRPPCPRDRFSRPMPGAAIHCRPAWLALVWLLCGLLGAVDAAAQLKPRTIEPLGTADQLKSQRQRELANELARRYLGKPVRGRDLKDLDTLQRLLDGRFIPEQEAFSQQALGLVFGDIMAHQLNLDWVVVDDDFGRSRALRWKREEDIFFPITMFSKRIGQGRPVRVRELYDEVAKRVAELKRRSRPSRRRVVLPPRPEN